MSTAVQEPRVAQSHFNMARADIPRLDEKGLGSKGAGNAKPVHPDSQWKTTEVVPLTRESFLDMLDGKTPLIKEAKFIPEQMNKKLAEELSPKLCPYLHATGPAVHKVGLAQFEFQAQSQEDFKTRSGEEKQHYFDEVKKLASMHKDLAKVVGEDVWAKVIKTLAALVPEWDFEAASEGEGKNYFSGIFRAINAGTPIHCDWSPYDSLTEDWILNRVTKQAVFNLYITPVKGGGTRIYDVQWTPEALEYRDPNSYGYYPDLVVGRKNVFFQPEASDLYLFNSRNMHEVFPVDPEWKAARMSLASFMGLLPSEETGGRPKLIFWS